MSYDFRVYGRNFTFDTETLGVVGQADNGCWYGPNGKGDGWQHPINPRNPWHIRAAIKSWITGRVAFLETS